MMKGAKKKKIAISLRKMETIAKMKTRTIPIMGTKLFFSTTTLWMLTRVRERMESEVDTIKASKLPFDQSSFNPVCVVESLE